MTLTRDKFSWILSGFVLILPLYVLRFSISGIPTTVLELGFGVVFVAWLLTFSSREDFLSRGKRVWRKSRFLWIATAVFLLSGFISFFVTPDMRAAAGLLKAYMIEPLIFAVIFLDTIQTPSHLKRLLGALEIAMVIVALIAIVQFVFHIGLQEPWNEPDTLRATSLYPFPNAVGLFLAPITALLLGFAWRSSFFSRRTRIRLLCSSLIGIGGILASVSHGAFAGVIAAIFLYCFFGRQKKTIALVWLALIFLVFVIPATRQAIWPILTFHDVSGEVRRVLWLGTWRLLEDHPWFGAGLSGFPELYNTYREARHTELLQYPHMIVFNVWVELGLLGLISFFSLIAASTKKIIQGIHSSSKKILIPAAGALLIIVVHGLVDVPFFKNDLAFLFWIILLLPFLSLQVDNATNSDV